MFLRAGERLGPYEIVAPLGAGGMGAVYRARDSRLNRDVAIKVSAANLSERFEREAKAIAALNHSNICQIHDVGPNYLVMELVEGTPLCGPLPLEQALRYAMQICDALDAAHKKNITHRDLKPGNILVTASGVKLLDFGLAKIGRADAARDPEATADPMDLTQPGTVLGTAAYMSPEQARGADTDARSDIFSFGVVLYEMLSGRRPFWKDSAVETMAAIVRDDPAPLDSPPNVWAVVARCLQKQPASRFQTIGEVREALARAAAKPTEAIPSIAVLPFANMSADKDNEYFSDGLAEEILNLLAKNPALKVIARTSAFAFKGQNIDIRKIAEILGVTNILEGSVRRAGNRVRVTAQLILAAGGSHLWSERYDRQMEDLFALQDEIAQAIAGELKLKLASAVRPRRQPNLGAYEAYLRYRQYQWAFTAEALARSRECLEQAIALDPEFALPYVGLADHYFASTVFGGAGELVPRARKLAERALELDRDLPEAYGMLGVLAVHLDPDWKEAEHWFRQALSREPISWHVRSWYSSFYLRPLGRNTEAREQAERAIEDNPLSQMLHWELANMLAGMGLEAESSAAYRKAVELDPQFWIGWWSLALFHSLAGSSAEALACAEKAYAILPHSFNIGVLAGTLRNRRKMARADGLLRQISNGSPGSSLGLACYHFIAGEMDQAVGWAGRAFDEGYPISGNMFIWPFEKQLRQSRAWPDLMKKLNLPLTR